ncbi:MAG: class I tRNA ligase family protein [Elusimicrobia bacterium]|nr:class I tRNA ligase family protein [Elusimicrobiota bacterium]
MSKSKKNVVNPDEIINVYGADAFRMYEMFMGPFEALKPWDMKGIEGVSRFLKRIWFWAQEVKISAAPAPKNVEILMHKSAQKVSHDIENMGFNTAISAMMIYFNEMSVLAEIPKSHVETFLKLLHPFAPHITEEIWERLDFGGFLAQSTWPSVNAELLKDEEIEIAVQVNGKIRGRIKITAAMSNGEVEKLALSQDSVKAAMGGKAAHKVIVVPKRMVSVAVK